jgi:hypothetical protein
MPKLSDVRFVKVMHSLDLFQIIKDHWQQDLPLILCPPQTTEIPNLENFNIPKDMILGLFTSGTSTGKPRLVIYSKKNILSSLESIRQLFHIKKIDHIFCYPQPTHVFGLVLGYLQSIICNIPISFSEGAYSQKSHQLWNEKLTEGTLTLGTPVHFYDLIQYNQKNNIKPIKSYSSIVGGALTSVDLWNQMKSFLNIESPSIGYGASEASPGICHLPPGIEPQFNGDVGFVLDGVTITNITTDGFEFSGDNVCLGILDGDKYISTKSVIIRDQVVQNERFCVFGRSDLAINRGGLKYNSETLESALLASGIKALFLPLYDQRLGDDLAVLVDAQEIEQTLKTLIQEIILKNFQIKLKDNHIICGRIPLNANLKIDRKEAMKLVIKGMGLKFPLDVQILKPFMPHRSSAIWVDEIIEFKPRHGVGRIYIDPKKFYMTNSCVRQSALIEFIAQIYGYSFILEEIFFRDEISVANNAFIAEVRDVVYSNTDLLSQDFSNAEKKYFDVIVECTHDFVKIKVIKGSIYYQNAKLAELVMKVAVF